MLWTAIWFVINLFFVSSAIAFLFMHRAAAAAREQGEPAERLTRRLKLRNAIGVFAIVAFLAMSASFLINMRLNG